MRKTVFKIIMIIMICLFAVVGVLVTTSIINSKSVAVEHAQKRLEDMSEKYASQFNSCFENAEIIVKTIADIAERDFVVNDYAGNRQAFESKKEQADTLVKKAISNSPYSMGLYITFDPDVTKGEDEVWYVKRENGEIIYIDSVELSDGWLIEETYSTEYYFKTIREGAYWSDAGYDLGMNGNVITYTNAAYDKDNRLIGVVGSDILVEDLFNSLGKIEKEISGNAVIVDRNGTLAAGQKHDYSQSRVVEARAKMGDKWELVLTQPVSVATDPIVQTEASIILLGILILIAAVILVIYFSRKTVSPMISESEQRDALLINQARQAKMGEMVGNIAHQWKQPLNNMQMSISNMQNDYDNGALNEEEFSWYTMRLTSMIKTLSDTVDDFTAFLRPARKTEKFSAGEEIKTVINMMNESLRVNAIMTEVNGENLLIEGYRNEFGQCIFNLLDNARDAVRENKAGSRTIKITLEKTDGYGIITVFNNGDHIDEAYKDRLFDLYFTTKEEKEGTGIGLYLTKEIIEKHFYGEIYFENTEGGVRFIIRIPLNKEKTTI